MVPSTVAHGYGTEIHPAHQAGPTGGRHWLCAGSRSKVRVGWRPVGRNASGFSVRSGSPPGYRRCQHTVRFAVDGELSLLADGYRGLSLTPNPRPWVLECIPFAKV